MAIHPDSDPKSASPRSGAPKGELEQYGVWVKAEPQDVIEEVASPSGGDIDFDLPADSASLPEESFLSEDEERLLGSFDSEFETSSAPSTSFGVEDSGLLPDIEDMPPLEESLLASGPTSRDEEISDFESGSIDISLDDIQASAQSNQPSPIHPGVELDMADIKGLDSPAATSHSEGIEDVSSEFLDLADEPATKKETPEFGTELDDVTAQFMDSEEPFSRPKEGAASSDFEPLDIDLQFDDSNTSLKPDTGLGAAEGGFESVTEFDDFLTVDDSTDAHKDAGFDDLSAVEADLSSSLPEPEELEAGAAPRSSELPPAASAARDAERQDLSTELLRKIAEELSSIRGELVSLKTRIGDIVVSAENTPPKAPESPLEEGEEAGPTGGFFDDEEDETIALTGDELDNILNTADFTEETAETQVPLELESESLPPEMSYSESSDLLEESLLPETGDYSSIEARSPAEPAIEEVRLGQSDSIDVVAEEPLVPEVADLNLFAEQGASHLTPAPDDTSFLEGPDPMDLGLPLNDEPLVEPDLSDFDLETEDLEPGLEIDEELPLASLEPEMEDVTLGIEAGPDYSSDENVVEAELLEPIPEIEETSYADINLHEEDQGQLSSTEPSDLEEIDFLSDSDLGANLASENPLPRSEELSLDEEDIVLAAEGEELPESLAELEPEPEPIIPEMSMPEPKPAPVAPRKAEAEPADNGERLKSEIKSVLSYLDKLLDSLPEEKIEEFARSEYFDTYKKLFEELGLV